MPRHLSVLYEDIKPNKVSCPIVLKVGRHELLESLGQGSPVVRFVARVEADGHSQDQEAQDVPHLGCHH